MFDVEGLELLEKTTSFLYDANGSEIRQKVNYLRPHEASMRQMTGGNLVGDTVSDEINTLLERVSSTYDGFNRLQSMEKIKDGTRATVEFIYNGDGLRTRKTVRSSEAGYTEQVTNYLYDRQYVILETNAVDEVSTRYVRGINYIARIDAYNKLSYYLFNGHGDVVQTVSETGEIENQYDYDIFGNPILTIETEYKNAIRYAGEFYDEETGLYYLRARYYNPYTGRFISEDSYWGEDTNPLSLNRYTYAHNNPIRYVDPTGHAAEYSGYSIVDYLNSSGGNASYSNRKGLAADHGIQGYRGTAQQNLRLLDLLRNQEKQPEPKPKIVSTPASSSTSSSTSGHSIVDYLNSSGEDSSFANRKELAKEQGITNYKGTAKQNLTLLSMMSGKPTPELDKKTAVRVIVSEQDEKEQPTYYLNSGNYAQSNTSSSSSDNLIYGVEESSYNKMPSHVQDSIKSSYKFRLFEDTSWNYVGFDVREAGSMLGRAQPRSLKELEELRELPQYKALMNAAQNRGLDLTSEEFDLISLFDEEGAEDYLKHHQNSVRQELNSTFKEQYNSYFGGGLAHAAHKGAREYSQIRYGGTGEGFDVVLEYKDRIEEVAKGRNIPPELIAAIIYKEAMTSDPIDYTDETRVQLGNKFPSLQGLPKVGGKFKDASMGLGQIFVETVRDAEDAGFVEITEDKMEVVRKLNDPNTNIDYIGAVLQTKARELKIGDKGKNLLNLSEDATWSLLKSYNGAGEYANKTSEYLPVLEELFKY